MAKKACPKYPLPPADSQPDAYGRLVNRLLASPHYGEKWARQWLDLAHYADSNGYWNDEARPYAWVWRQWVIKALNCNMPFDQFTIDQIAGDLLPGATLEQRIATGFFRNTLTGDLVFSAAFFGIAYLVKAHAGEEASAAA